MTNRGACIAAFAALSFFHPPSLVDGHGYCRVRNGCSLLRDVMCIHHLQPLPLSFTLFISIRFLRSCVNDSLLFIKLRSLPVLVTTTPTTSLASSNAPARPAVLLQNTVRIAATSTMAFVASPRTIIMKPPLGWINPEIRCHGVPRMDWRVGTRKITLRGGRLLFRVIWIHITMGTWRHVCVSSVVQNPVPPPQTLLEMN